jgi:hypothetical protein
MTTPWIFAFVALWVLVVLLGLLVLGTVRRATLVIEAAEANLGAAARASLGGLPVGSNVPAFSAPIVGSGAAFTQVDLQGGVAGVVFLSRSCEACEELAGGLARGRVPRTLGVRLIVVTDEPQSAAAFARSAEATIVIDEEREVAHAFDVRIVPRAFVVGDGGVVLAVGRPNDWGELHRLIAEAEGGDRQAHLTAASLAL